ncbi:MAG TPA: radical SAM protein, partial [Thermoplasmatales archaeon]|nr:radical SAM protein [Thermoplasmatales archaeon]
LDDYSINPYYGCSFNCIYCYVKGSKYGKNTKDIFIKINAPEILEKELKRQAKKRNYGFIAISTSTEPYMHIEERTKLTRKLLEIISKYRFPVHILTKSPLVLRDIDLLKKIDENAILPKDLKGKLKGVIISFSISTLDEEIAKFLEPYAPPPEKRLEAMQKCKEENLQTGVCYIPVLPFISDSEEKLDEMVKVAKDYGASYCLIGALTLFGEKETDCKKLYYKFLEKHFSELVPKYNELYEFSFQPRIEYQMKLEKMAKKICEKYGVKYRIV